MFTNDGVDVLFSGHDHIYERVHPQKGIYYLTEGSSGQVRDRNPAKTGIKQNGSTLIAHSC
jgi:predicted phosphodiesterase